MWSNLILQFNKEPGKAVEEFKLRVIYVAANPPSPVPEGSEEGSSPRASLSDNGNLNVSLIDAVSILCCLGFSFQNSAYGFNSLHFTVFDLKVLPIGMYMRYTLILTINVLIQISRSLEEPKEKSSEVNF